MSNTSGDRSIQRREGGGGDEAIARRLGSNVKKKRVMLFVEGLVSPWLHGWFFSFLMK